MDGSNPATAPLYPHVHIDGFRNSVTSRQNSHGSHIRRVVVNRGSHPKLALNALAGSSTCQLVLFPQTRKPLRDLFFSLQTFWPPFGRNTDMPGDEGQGPGAAWGWLPYIHWRGGVICTGFVLQILEWGGPPFFILSRVRGEKTP